MAEAAKESGHDLLEEKLGRLLKKPGVKASIVLDRLSGAVLKMSGEASTFRAANVGTTAATAANLSSEGDGGDDGESKAMQDFAAMIWNFVNSSGQLLQDMDPEDELKLLRLRSKKQEIVIVPDPKYLLTVIHDTPPA